MELSDGPFVPGYPIEELNILIDRFRIPPKEIEEMLPQQAAGAMSAAAALDDVRRRDNASDSATALPSARKADPRAGVFLGVSLDLNTTNFHLRWWTKDRAAELADSAGPPLSADRTMGALASCAASRIAKVFQFGGPSFTVCSEGTSSGRALELAVRALRMGELDRAVVGGVDFNCDPRAVAAADSLHRFSSHGVATPLATNAKGAVPGEGSAAVVLKRLADAERDGDRVYAVIRGIGSSVGGTASGSAPDSAAYASSFLRALSDASIPAAGFDYLELASSGHADADAPESDALLAILATAKRSFPLSVGAVSSQIGQTGAAAFLAGFVKTCLAIYHEILPPAPIPTAMARLDFSAANRIQFTTAPQYWLTERPNVRRAAVAGMSVDGTVVHAVLEEHEKNRPQPVEVRSRPNVERRQPLGTRPEAVFAVEYEQFDEWNRKAAELDELAATNAGIERLARQWLARHRPDSKKRRAVAFVARDAEDLRKLIRSAQTSLTNNPDAVIPEPLRYDPQAFDRDRIFHSPRPLGRLGKLAFVFPGSGNQYSGMGRTISTQWPELLRRQQAENEMLRGQYAPERFWSDEIPADTQAKQFLFGQVAFGTLTSDLLQVLGVKPDAMIGLSLGESAGLFGTRVWRARDEMLRRVRESTLFGPDLGPPYHAAQQHFHYTSHGPVDWVVGIVSSDPDDIRSKMRPKLRAFLLIVNTPNECVIGGFREDVQELVTLLGVPFIGLSGVTLAHCEAGKPVERSYRELHRLPTVPVSGLKVYSGAWGRSYVATDANAADSITAGLIHTLDFPAVIEAAYRDGVRMFVETGPGASCTRMIDTILGNRPHLARAMTAPRQDELSLILRVVANLVAERTAVDLGGLYGRETAVPAHLDLTPSNRPTVALPVGLVGAAIPVVMPSADGDSSIFRTVKPAEIAALETFGRTPEAWHAFDASERNDVQASADLPPVDYDESIIKTTPRPKSSKSSPSTTVESRPVDTVNSSDLAAAKADEVYLPEVTTPSEDLPPVVAAISEPSIPEQIDPETIPDQPVATGPTADDLDFVDTVAQPIPAEIPVQKTKPSSVRHYDPQWIEPVLAASVGAQAVTASAHELFLRVQSDATSTAAAAVGVHSELVRRLLGNVDDEDVVLPSRMESGLTAPHSQSQPQPSPQPSHEVPRALNTEQCFEFARGLIGNVLGTQFADVDRHPTRVRLPDNELMLVDRITLIEGEPKSMTKGRCITEHLVHTQRWYLDSGVCPTSITVESGQADLFLSGFLGIDFQTKGLAVY
ncbi:MAG: beta-ketoacyl synthase N-terminal-like domain-containing protein, partial [Gemmataceae bacterium]